MEPSIQQVIEALYREQTGKALAFLVSLLGDLAEAEEIWQETLTRSLQQWEGSAPPNPVAWCFKVARNLAIDKLRHQSMSLEKSRLLAALSVQQQDQEADWPTNDFQDEQLRLMFACCHPALSLEKQVPLTLNVICGLKTEHIARMLMLEKSALEQRLTRAKRKLKSAGIPFKVPERHELAARIHAVLNTVYLVFNSADALNNTDQQQEVDAAFTAQQAVRLVEWLKRLLPDSTETVGLHALMLFHLARSRARFNKSGELILLADQDRRLWDQSLIEKADDMLQQALLRKKPGSYQLQAAIQGVHCLAKEAEQTDWMQIEGLYHVLMQVDDSPIIKLNAAVAIGMHRGMDKALVHLQKWQLEQTLKHYTPFYAARAEMLLKTDQAECARRDLQLALEYSQNPKERRTLERKLSVLDAS